ncbi:MAG: P1 family peptidase [Lachnospiraceae bacterium]|nr:P1 family peptidase [Lachnospiraceae bacterium]
MKEIKLTEIEGFRIGHAENQEGMTGCTVMLFDACTPAGVDVRGGGPASRETPLLNPVMDAKGIHGILLSGGSAFGLDAAGGVMKYLEERGIGFDVGITKVPLVCQSSLFDLMVGDMTIRPDAAMGYAACLDADDPDTVPETKGAVGAGLGCTVGKYRGPEFCMPSGLGSYAVSMGDLQVGALVAVNALGDIYDPETNKKLAGVKGADGKLLASPLSYFDAAYEQAPSFSGNTTLGIIVTNAEFEKTALNKIASMAHNGYAAAIRPVHTMADGDSIYAVSTGKVKGDINLIGPLAAYVMGRAIADAAKSVQQ